MDKNEKGTNAESHFSMTKYETWAEELVEQAKQDSCILKKCWLFLWLSMLLRQWYWR